MDKANVEVIKNLPLLTIVKQLRGFLRHFGFYRRFIKYFTTISKPLTHLLSKNVDFILDESIKKKKSFFQIINSPIFRPLIVIVLWNVGSNYDIDFDLYDFNL